MRTPHAAVAVAAPSDVHQPRPFTGVVAYPVTPFDERGDVAHDVLRQLVSGLCGSRVDAVAVLGTSGSGMYLDRPERRTVVQGAVRARDDAGVRTGGGAVPVYAAVSALATREAVTLARDAVDAGADGVLVAPVGYLPLTDEEVTEHVTAVLTAVDVPVCFYNNPTTTRYDVTLPVLQRLCVDGGLVAIKDTAVDETAWCSRVAGYGRGGLACAVGLSRDALLLSARSPVDAWHSGVAGVLPDAYAGLRSALLDDDEQHVARWTSVLRPVVDELARWRPIAGLHALYVAAGVPAAAPRRPLLAAPEAAVNRFRELLARVEDA